MATTVLVTLLTVSSSCNEPGEARPCRREIRVACPAGPKARQLDERCPLLSLDETDEGDYRYICARDTTECASLREFNVCLQSLRSEPNVML